MFTRAVKVSLVALATRGQRPDNYTIDTLKRLKFVDDECKITATGGAKVAELLAIVRLKG